MKACQDPNHDGDRLITSRFDAWQYRTTYYRSDGAVRRHEKTQQIVCTGCMERRERTPLEDAQVGMGL